MNLGKCCRRLLSPKISPLIHHHITSYPKLYSCRHVHTTHLHYHQTQEPETQEPETQEPETHFGYQSVPESEKEGKVREVFEKVADSYDLMNDTMSLGVHRVWKDHFVRSAAPAPHYKCLDVAGGTGDIAFKLHNYMRNINQDSEPVTVCDINPEMLRVGQSRAELAEIGNNFTWMEGNAEQLDLPDDSFDLYTIAFGIRNCTHVDRVLEEAYRVLKPGGRFMCLEFSEVPNPIIAQIYDRYSFDVIPVLGQVVAGDFESYQYLVESIRKFPNQEKFADMISSAGFSVVEYDNLTFGVTAVHSGYKI